MVDDKNFKALLDEQKRFTEEQKKATIALNKIAKINEEQGPPLPPDNKDVVAGLDKLGQKIEDGNKSSEEGDKKTLHGYDTSDKNKFIMEKKAIEDRRKAQDDFQKAIEAQGGDVKRNYAFQREQTKITKADFALKRKLADTPGSKKELKKEEAEALKDAVTGPLQRGFKGLTGAFGKLSGVFKSKFGGSIKTLGSLLKFGLGGIALLALSKFLQSETWKNWKEDLIPNLVKAFEIAGDILGFIFKKITNGFKAVKALFGGFFDEDGFKGGFKQLFENIGCIGPAILGIGLAFAGVATALSLVGLGIVPRLLFGGLMKGGKWLIAKPFIAAFKGLGKLLGLGGAKSLAGGGGLVKASFWSKTVQTTKGIFSGIAKRFTNLAASLKNIVPKIGTTIANTVGGMFTGIRDRLATIAAKAAGLAAPLVNKVKNVVKPIATLMGGGASKAGKVAAKVGGYASKGIKAVGSAAGGLAKSGVDIFKKFPKYAKVAKIAGKLPLIGPIISSALMIGILTGKGSKKEKAKQIGGLVGSVGGAVVGGALGAMIGTAGGPLALVTGLLGAIGGSFLGDNIGTAMGQYMLGEKIDAFGWPFNWVDDILNGKSSGKIDKKLAEGGGGDGGVGASTSAELTSAGGGNVGGATITPQDSLVSDAVRNGSTQQEAFFADDEDGTGENQKITINGVQFDKNSPEVKSLRNLPKAKNDGGSSGTMNPNTSTASQKESANNVNVSPTTITNNASSTQVVSKNVVEPDVYFQRQSNWAI